MWWVYTFETQAFTASTCLLQIPYVRTHFFARVILTRVTILLPLALGLFMCQLSMALASDVTLSGVVNFYSPVTRIDQRCSTVITVDNAAGFSVGDRVLIMQMQGADVDRSNSGSHGRVVSLNSAGRFEFGTVSSIDAGTRQLHLREPLGNTYDVTGRVQVIRVVTATNATIAATVTAQPWNGRIGGVVVLEITNDLRLDGFIDVRNCGFAGGVLWQGALTCSVTDMYGAQYVDRVAARGHGIAVTVPGFEAGRGSWANGGGGGAAHNSGGGGGGNGGAGGKGGNQWITCGATADNGGFGGAAIPFDVAQPRLVMGGGGGSGQQNDNVGTGGVRGGGIVIIRCSTLTGSGQIHASGTAVSAVAQNDGAGGGGAGGAVWLEAASADNRLRVFLRGGNGGNVRTGVPHGPGGGGGGGLFITSWPSSGPDLGVDLAGGAPGLNVNATGTNRVYFTQSGQAGLHYSGLALPRESPTTPPSIIASGDTTVCAGSTVRLAARVLPSSPSPSITWVDADRRRVSTQASVDVVATRSMRYVCTVTDRFGCEATDTVDVVVTPKPRLALANINLGPTGACSTPADTAVWLYNRGSTPAVISRISTRSSASTTVDSTAVTLAPGDSIRIRIGRGGAVTSPVTVEAVAGPCDTVLASTVQWQTEGFEATLTPPSIVRGPFLSCKTVVLQETLTLSVTGDTAAIVGSIEEGNATWQTPPRGIVSPAAPAQLMARIVADRNNRVGRLAVILEAGDCIDTVWCTIDVTFHPPIFPTDTIDLGVIDRCLPDATYRVAIPSVSTESLTVAHVESSSPSIVVLTHSANLSPRGELVVTIRYNGGSHTTGTLDIYFAECDSVVTIPIRWSYDGSLFVVEPAVVDLGDSIICNERIVTITPTVRSVVGPGTISATIVQGASINVDTPNAAIADGGEQSVEIRWSMPLGQANARVGVVVTSSRCVDTLWVDLLGFTRTPDLRVTDILRVEGGTIGTVEQRRMVIENPSTVDVLVTSIRLPEAPFSVDTMGLYLPRRIAAGATVELPVDVTRACGAFVDSVVVYSTTPCALERETRLELQATTVTTIELVSVEAGAGGIVEIPVVVAGRPNAVPELTQSFTLTLQMDKTVAAPLPEQTPGLVDVRYTDTKAFVTSRLPWDGSDTLARIPVLAMLAAAAEDAVSIADGGFIWSGIDCTLNHTPAVLTLGPPCAGRELRLVRVGGAISGVRISPMPASTWLDVTIDATAEEAFDIAFVDVTGRTLAPTKATSNNTVRISTDDAPSGLMMLHIRGRFETVILPVMVVR